MRAVNLLPREEQDRNSLRSVDKVRVGAIVLTLVVLVAVSSGFVLAHAHARTEQRQLATARATLAQLQARQQAGSPSTPALPSPSVTSQEQPWRLALSTALATRIPWDRTLAELARVVPANVTLSNVTIGAGTGSTSSAGSVTLSGNAYSQEGIAQFLSRLMLVPDLAQVSLTSTSTDPKSGIVTFDIEAQAKDAATAFTPTPTTTPTPSTTTAGGSA